MGSPCLNRSLHSFGFNTIPVVIVIGDAPSPLAPSLPPPSLPLHCNRQGGSVDFWNDNIHAFDPATETINLSPSRPPVLSPSASPPLAPSLPCSVSPSLPLSHSSFLVIFVSLLLSLSPSLSLSRSPSLSFCPSLSLSLPLPLSLPPLLLTLSLSHSNAHAASRSWAIIRKRPSV